MTRKKAAVAALALASGLAVAQVPEQRMFSPEKIRKGADIFAQNCSPCHGPGMFDLRKFPPDQKNRFVTSVVKGKNQMPRYGNLFKPDDIDALWAYVIAGEKE